MTRTSEFCRLCLFSILPFVPCLGADLLLDDRILLSETAWLQESFWAPWKQNLGASGTFRPLSVYALGLTAQLPIWLNQLLNLLLHALSVLLVCHWLRYRLSAYGALIGAVFFAVHAAHVGALGWMAGRPDIMMSIFAVSSLIAMEQGRSWLCALFVLACILSKETGVSIVLVLWFLASSAKKPMPFGSMGMVVGTGICAFALSWLMSDVAQSYLPSSAGIYNAIYWLPFYFIELFAPLFYPVGALSLLRDFVGFLLAIIIFVTMYRRGVMNDPSFRRASTFTIITLLPVAHVIQNDGGQWYLLLPSVAAGWFWGAIASRKPARWHWWVLVGLSLMTFWESLQWRKASVQVSHLLQLPAGQTEVVPTIPRQNPIDWPHRGPSICCGVPSYLRLQPSAHETGSNH